MRPRNVEEEGEAPESVAVQLGRQAEDYYAETGRVDEWSHETQPASASALLQQMGGHNRQPDMEADAPTEPLSKTGVTWLMDTYRRCG
jgi:hypothetical protein